MKHHELLSRVESLPRCPLALLPTPLQECPRLSQVLGVRVLMKRDDLTGLALGGNKTRQFEFVMPRVIAERVETIVAGAFVQSNWCRQLAAACAQLGINVELMLARGSGRYENKLVALQGNLLLDRILGAKVRIIDVADVFDLAAEIETRVGELRSEGRMVMGLWTFLPWVQALSAVAYVGGTLELLEQAKEIGIRHIYVSGATTTPAGMALTLKALGCDVKLRSVTPIAWEESRADDIARIASDAGKLLSLDVQLLPSEVYNDSRWVGAGYDQLTDWSVDAMEIVGRLEGIILDPIYTGRAMASMIADVRDGVVKKGETVVFVHTGGAPGNFAYAEELEAALGGLEPSVA